MDQSAGAVEYTNCISAEGHDSPNECPRYNNKQSDGEVSVIFWALGNAELPLIVILQYPLCPGVVALDRVQSMS